MIIKIILNLLIGKLLKINFSPSKINFGIGFGTNQTHFKNALEHGSSSGNLFNTK